MAARRRHLRLRTEGERRARGLLPRLQGALARGPSPATLILFADRRVPAAAVRGLVEALPPASKCGTADVEALTAIVWTMVGNPGQIPVAVTRDPQAEAVTLATVGDLAALAESRGGRAFRLAP